MPDLSRRNFVAGTSAATAIAMAAAAGLGSEAAGASATDSDKLENRPVVARVLDLASGKVALYVGTREVVVHDKTLAVHLAKAAASL